MLHDTDIVIGGGGIAGTVAAAALHQLGYRIVLVEPGQHDERRLAGEVFHPPGVTGLAQLDLLGALQRGPVAWIKGFSVSTAASSIRLPYDTVAAHRTSGLCLEHAMIRQQLLDAVSALPGVTVLRRMRVIAVNQSNSSQVAVAVANGDVSEQYRCQLLVAADGAQSRLARSIGIDVRHRTISTMFGYRLAAEHLAEPDYGHVVLGARAPILLYPINRDQARILFDVPHTSDSLPRPADCVPIGSVLSAPLRQEVERALATQRPMSVFARTVTADRLVQGRVVLVGDAAGACHPLTANGMTRCVSDALLLRDSLADEPNDLANAVKNYERRRRWPQATRLTLADALRDAFCGETSEARILQRGIISYCRTSASGRAATMALLSTADGRPFALLREVARVAMRGFLLHLRAPLPPDDGSHAPALRVLNRLLAAMFGHVKQILQSATPVSCLRPRGTNACGSEQQRLARSVGPGHARRETPSGPPQ